jgi:hypothetical protein
MLWWFSLAVIVALLAIAVPATLLRRRRARRDEIENNGPDLEDIMSEIDGVAELPIAESEDELAE